MNLHALLTKRNEEKGPLRVGLIGAGKFGSMYLAQAKETRGIHLAAIADLAPARAVEALRRTGWRDGQGAAASLPDALAKGTTFLTDDAISMIASPGLDVIIDATGSPSAGIVHVLACCRQGKHIIMVNVEADALAGPLLARRAREAGIIYSLAYGDQPALICELVDWARACGFTVVAAGKGTKYLPVYHQSTPDTVWSHYGFTEEQLARGDFNAKMFNSFLDGTKSAIEMAAVANATGLVPPKDGLCFPPCGADDLPRILKPRAAGGLLDEAGQVEVVSSLERDGRPVFRDLRWGVYVTFTTENSYSARCFREYGVITDESGRYSALYRPAHLIGLELGISVASAALRGEPTGAARDFTGDVAATAKRDLFPGDTLDGEGGFTVYGTLLPARKSIADRCFPIGLAHQVEIKRPIVAGKTITWNDVAYNEKDETVKFRLEMEAAFKKEWSIENDRK
ncbi:MAG: flagellar biosynthesis protein FlgA [Proteobacteria bacterium]|nr:flagellar biosynthesis protein FlgA [Pseudomonadota bacterium]